MHLVGYIIRISDSIYKSDLIMDRHLSLLYILKTDFWGSTHFFIQSIQGAFLPKVKQLSHKSANSPSFGGEVNA